MINETLTSDVYLAHLRATCPFTILLLSPSYIPNAPHYFRKMPTLFKNVFILFSFPPLYFFSESIAHPKQAISMTG